MDLISLQAERACDDNGMQSLHGHTCLSTTNICEDRSVSNDETEPAYASEKRSRLIQEPTRGSQTGTHYDQHQTDAHQPRCARTDAARVNLRCHPLEGHCNPDGQSLSQQ